MNCDDSAIRFFGLPEADCLLGSPLKSGQIIELAGPSQCGKTYLALSACSRKEFPIWIDGDSTFPATYAERLGLSGRIAVIPPHQEITAIVQSFLDSVSPDLIVFDPTQAVTSRTRIELYKLLSYHTSRLGIQLILCSSGVDSNRMATLASIRIEMAQVKYRKTKATYLMRTIKNINAPAWQEATFSKEIE